MIKITHKMLNRYFLFIIMLVIVFFMLIPFFWMLSTSFKTTGEVFAIPKKWIPKNLHWENYIRSLNVVPLGHYIFNSFIVSSLITVIHLIVASLAAYAFARLEFPGRDKLFLVFLATLMVPGQVTMIPNFILMKIFGWLDTYIGLILPNAFTAFGIFLLRQFFITIPKDYEEAAMIDGASRFHIYLKVIIPLAVPAISALGVFTFVFQWNNLLWPLIVVNKDVMKTITVGLASFQGMYGTSWNMLMAAAVIGIIPSLIVFIFGQKYLIKGITLSGLKG